MSNGRFPYKIATAGQNPPRNLTNYTTGNIKFIAAHAIETYRRSVGMPPLILNLGTRWR